MSRRNEFSLNPSLATDELRVQFHSHGRLEIANLFPAPLTENLRAHLLHRKDWLLVMNAGEKVYEMPRAKFHELDALQRRTLAERVSLAAQQGFQYQYETIRVPDRPEDRRPDNDLLYQFVNFMSSAPMLDFMQAVTGYQDLAFADGQATAYSAGHFLTRHDDNIEGKHRRAAYVFGLTPSWQAEWGGLLLFHGEDGDVEEVFIPRMGVLRIFSVPASHSVSYVTPFAPEPRLSITGWLRSQSPSF